MKIGSLLKRLNCHVTHFGLLLTAASIPLVSKAAPYWDVSGPGTIGGYSYQFPMVAKEGVLYLPTTYQTLHISKWTSSVGQSDLGQLFPVGNIGPWVNSMYIQGNYVYVAGYFTITNNFGTLTNIAKYDIPNNIWVRVGDGTLTDEIFAVAVDSNGRVYVGAGAVSDRGASVHSLLKYWSGSAWVSVGSGMYGSATELYGVGQVTALAANGTDIYAAGNFDAGVSGGTAVYSTNIIKWDGSSWHAMGTPAGNGIMVDESQPTDFHKLVVSGSNVFVAGRFQLTVDSLPAAPVGLDRFSTNCSHVQAYNLHTDTDAGWGSDISARDGVVYLGGTFNYIDSTTVTNVAQWDGTGWSGLGSGVNAGCGVAAADADPCTSGDVVFIWGAFDHAGGQATSNGPLVRWIPDIVDGSCGGQ